MLSGRFDSVMHIFVLKSKMLGASHVLKHSKYYTSGMLQHETCIIAEYRHRCFFGNVYVIHTVHIHRRVYKHLIKSVGLQPWC